MSEENHSIDDFSSKQKGDINEIFIGSKPLVNYVKGVMIQFSKPNSSEVVVRSRGKFISKAVDVVEIVKRSFEGANVKSVSFGSESFEVDGRKTNISTMDVTLFKR